MPLAYPDMSTTYQNFWILDKFINGLNSVPQREHVSYGHPTNLKEAISMAIEFEEHNNTNNNNTVRFIERPFQCSKALYID